MRKIKYPSVIEISQLELIKFQLDWVLKGIYDANDTEKYTLAYVHVYGRDAIYKMVEDKRVTNSKSIENYISEFRKKGFIIGYRDKTSLHKDIAIVLGDLSYTIEFKVAG